eukprot:GFYU01012276.1.p1 GENE.GFYU01012276.1~~GFYU01012276.1.p1  ORF type:complete len:169 (-),score=10.87 GFYU01012276.1:143-649(-)
MVRRIIGQPMSRGARMIAGDPIGQLHRKHLAELEKDLQIPGDERAKGHVMASLNHLSLKDRLELAMGGATGSTVHVPEPEYRDATAFSNTEGMTPRSVAGGASVVNHRGNGQVAAAVYSASQRRNTGGAKLPAMQAKLQAAMPAYVSEAPPKAAPASPLTPSGATALT